MELEVEAGEVACSEVARRWSVRRRNESAMECACTSMRYCICSAIPMYAPVAPVPAVMRPIASTIPSFNTRVSFLEVVGGAAAPADCGAALSGEAAAAAAAAAASRTVSRRKPAPDTLPEGGFGRPPVRPRALLMSRWMLWRRSSGLAVESSGPALASLTCVD